MDQDWIIRNGSFGARASAPSLIYWPDFWREPLAVPYNERRFMVIDEASTFKRIEQRVTQVREGQRIIIGSEMYRTCPTYTIQFREPARRRPTIIEMEVRGVCANWPCSPR